MRRAAAFAAATLLLGGCGTSQPAPKTTAARSTVWLCRPGIANDPCTAPLTATVIGAAGRQGVLDARPAANPPIDCFYVYPTVSEPAHRPTPTSQSGPEERAVAIAQASRFSAGRASVYAPIYPPADARRAAQHAAQASPRKQAADRLRRPARPAFDDYLRNYNHGRGIVLHRPLPGRDGADQPARAARRSEPGAATPPRLGATASAADVAVGPGGDFSHIPPCSARAQTGCVVAYSSFLTQPPAGAYFGRDSSTLDPFAGNPPTTHVLCVNPASPAGGSAPLRHIRADRRQRRQGADAVGLLPRRVHGALRAPRRGELASDRAPWRRFGRPSRRQRVRGPRLGPPRLRRQPRPRQPCRDGPNAGRRLRKGQRAGTVVGAGARHEVAAVVRRVGVGRLPASEQQCGQGRRVRRPSGARARPARAATAPCYRGSDTACCRAAVRRYCPAGSATSRSVGRRAGGNPRGSAGHARSRPHATRHRARR